jgi:hypothetical protein
MTGIEPRLLVHMPHVVADEGDGFSPMPIQTLRPVCTSVIDAGFRA